MAGQAPDAYYVGLHGQIDVLDNEGGESLRVEGEIVRLLQVSETAVYAFIRTRMGTGLYQL
jgi:hypothetical protein